MATFDFEEVAPDRFMLNHPQLRGLVRREGEVQGRFFVLTSWRREGLLARLRGRGFSVQTLQDEIDALPALPENASLGAALMLNLGALRVSVFDPDALRWTPLVPGQPLSDHEPVRQRRGRGVPSYALASPGGLRPVSEQRALLTAYALSVPSRATLTVLPEGRWQLPDVDLPPPHRALLRRIAADGSVAGAGRDLAAALFARLGVTLQAGET